MELDDRRLDVLSVSKRPDESYVLVQGVRRTLGAPRPRDRTRRQEKNRVPTRGEAVCTPLRR